MKIEYITSNKKKFEEARLILSDWDLEQIDINLTEIQGDRFEIVKAKAREAFRILQRPLIVEDVSLCSHALGGLPGPYVKDFLTRLGDQGLYELIHKYSDHSVDAICLAAYIDSDGEPLTFEGIIKGKIVAPRGNTRHGKISWNTIFVPDGSIHTYGEMTIEEHAQSSMRKIALDKLKEHFKKKL